MTTRKKCFICCNNKGKKILIYFLSKEQRNAMGGIHINEIVLVYYLYKIMGR